MDILSESIEKKIKEIKAKIQKINYIQEFDKAREFQKLFEQVQENISLMTQVERQTHLYYSKVMDALYAIEFEIDDYLENEGKIKEQELNRSVFLAKIGKFVDNAKEKSWNEMLADARKVVQDVKKMELEESLFSELYDMTAKVVVRAFTTQIKVGEEIDFGIVEEVSTKEAFAKAIQKQLAEMAEAQKADKAVAYDILQVCQKVSAETIDDLEIWQTLSGNDDVKIKPIEAEKEELPAEETQEKQLVSLDPKRKTVIDKLRDMFTKKDGSTIYTFGKFNKETGQYENIRVEEHSFPPKKKSFIKRCQKECIGLDINDVDTITIEEINANMPNLQSLSFGSNVREITRGELNRWEKALKNLKKVEFSDDVQILRKHAFANCVGITNVKFGENIEEIGNACFYNCGLETVKLPDKLSKMGGFVFSHCENLKSVDLPKNLSEIEDYAFEGCKNLQTVNLPENLLTLNVGAFRECSILQEIRLPDTLTEIGTGAFLNCSELRNVKLPISLKEEVLKQMSSAFDEGVHLEVNGEIFEVKRKWYFMPEISYLVPLKKTLPNDDTEFSERNGYVEEEKERE